MQTNTVRTAAATPRVTPAEDKREAKRINIAVPVKVFLEAAGLDYQHCCTFEISMTGARLMAGKGIRQVGQTVWLQRHNRRARYKIIWIGEPGTTQAGQFGVETLEPTNVIWENELKLRIMQA